VHHVHVLPACQSVLANKKRIVNRRPEVFGSRSISEVIVEELPTIRSEPNCHIHA
jgi:hypothetical protein